MDLKTHAKYSLEKARSLTEKLLDSFKSEDEWFYQSHPKANHAMWIVGHLALADNAFLSRFREDIGTKPDGWDDLFWYRSELQERGKYPRFEDVLRYFRDRRAALMQVVDDLSDDELSAPAPQENSPIAGAPCIGHLLLFAAYHEGVHSGQLTIARRGLGYDPLF